MLADFNGCGAQTRDLCAKIRGSNGPGARTAVALKLLVPFVRGHRGWIGIGLNRDLFEIGTIGKTGERHFRGVVRMRPAVLARQPCGLKRTLHGPNIFAGDRGVVDFKFHSHQREASKHEQDGFEHRPILVDPERYNRYVVLLLAGHGVDDLID
jgi:hypothetical protein